MRQVLETVFWIAFGVGLGYSLIGFLLRGVLHGFDLGEHNVDVGGHDADIGGHDVGDHSAEAGHHGVEAIGGEPHASPFNTLTIATFLLGFGGLGLLALRFGGLGVITSLIIALVGAIALAAAFFFGFMRVVYGSQGTSAPSIRSILRTPGRVSVSIPAAGTGEINYVTGGSRFSLPACSIDGVELARGTEVAIVEIRKGVAYVTPLNIGRELKSE